MPQNPPSKTPPPDPHAQKLESLNQKLGEIDRRTQAIERVTDDETFKREIRVDIATMKGQIKQADMLSWGSLVAAILAVIVSGVAAYFQWKKSDEIATAQRDLERDLAEKQRNSEAALAGAQTASAAALATSQREFEKRLAERQEEWDSEKIAYDLFKSDRLHKIEVASEMEQIDRDLALAVVGYISAANAIRIFERRMTGLPNPHIEEKNMARKAMLDKFTEFERVARRYGTASVLPEAPLEQVYSPGEIVTKFFHYLDPKIQDEADETDNDRLFALRLQRNDAFTQMAAYIDNLILSERHELIRRKPSKDLHPLREVDPTPEETPE